LQPHLDEPPRTINTGDLLAGVHLVGDLVKHVVNCWRLIIVSKFVCDLQAYKSPVVVKGPFFPRVVNPRYRIHGTNVWRKT
jgi:hypothetical protein